MGTTSRGRTGHSLPEKRLWCAWLLVVGSAVVVGGAETALDTQHGESRPAEVPNLSQQMGVDDEVSSFLEYLRHTEEPHYQKDIKDMNHEDDGEARDYQESSHHKLEKGFPPIKFPFPGPKGPQQPQPTPQQGDPTQGPKPPGLKGGKDKDDEDDSGGDDSGEDSEEANDGPGADDAEATGIGPGVDNHKKKKSGGDDGGGPTGNPNPQESDPRKSSMNKIPQVVPGHGPDSGQQSPGAVSHGKPNQAGYGQPAPGSPATGGNPVGANTPTKGPHGNAEGPKDNPFSNPNDDRFQGMPLKKKYGEGNGASQERDANWGKEFAWENPYPNLEPKPATGVAKQQKMDDWMSDQLIKAGKIPSDPNMQTDDSDDSGDDSDAKTDYDKMKEKKDPSNQPREEKENMGARGWVAHRQESRGQRVLLRPGHGSKKV